MSNIRTIHKEKINPLLETILLIKDELDDLREKVTELQQARKIHTELIAELIDKLNPDV